MSSLDFDALALEYQRDYGTARSDLDIPDFFNQPLVNCVTDIFSLSFAEKSSDIFLREIGILGHDVSNFFLVTQDTT